MAEEKEFIQISASDLSNPKVDEIVAQQQAGRQVAVGQRLVAATPFYLSPVFYLGIAGALGAAGAWALVTPHLYKDEMSLVRDPGFFDDFVLFGSVAGMIGLLIGATEGLVSRNLMKGLLGGSIGLAMGIAGGVVSTVVAEIVFNLIPGLCAQFLGLRRGEIPSHSVLSWMFISLVMARSLAWSVVGMTVALGQGIAMKSGKMTMTGFLGGMVGGAVGGMFFDPVGRILEGTSFGTTGAVSRLVGVTCVGLMSGIFVGLVEHFAKEAWLLMAAGPLAGKQFVVYKNPTTLGSSPKCDIYLFKDPAIEPRHAQIHKVGVSYEIEDLGSASGTYVNQVPIKRQRLKDGDRIALGQTVLQYMERAKEGKSGH